MSAALYPAGPAHVPADLAKPSGRYRLLVTATLLSIVLFLAVYVAMVAGSIKLFVWVATFRFESYSFWGLIFHLALAIAALMLTAFLLKFAFKWNKDEDDKRLRLVPESHPELVAFIEQLCTETGAPRPKHIYLTPDVNAAVFYQHPLLSLVWPARKSLLIGAGLVNALTLSEFKAVLAHEFGHFAQRSMRLGSYVYTANRLLHDMVFGRDKWDELLAEWRRLDLRVSAVAWGLTGMVWLVRQALALAYRGVNLVHASLSREMEFQADRVAVQVAGSDAIVNALYQINRASWAYQTSLGQLGTALEHNLVSDDVYYHQQLRLADCPPAPPAFRHAAAEALAQPAQLFTAEEVTTKAEMYASHPADYLREQSAKQPYVAAPADDRSPWLLFQRPEEVRQLVTRKLYPDSAAKHPVRPAAEVEEFLAAETAELTYDEAYAETYDVRVISLIEPEQLDALAAKLPADCDLLALRQELYGPELRQRMEAHQSRKNDLAKLALFISGEAREATFTVDGVSYPAAQAREVAKKLEAEESAHKLWLSEFDERCAGLHWRLLAGQPERRAAWQARYALQLHLRLGILLTSEALQQLQQLVDGIMAAGQVQPNQVNHYVTQFEQLRQRLLGLITTARSTTLLPLRHLEDLATVADFVMRDLHFPTAAVLSGDWLNGFGHVLEVTLDRYRRLYYKNLGVVLRLQEEAAAEHAATATPIVAAVPEATVAAD
ncbi:M48 family metallopeptidase [Hymenobacter sp. CRA2]|uniref:M48 family metallopeptidase n=1 Tax=Hymenobacter sp. CRA2 TaxID=1955620 RepID=UPI00098F2E68|nr:M48 family metallopeptidase [Hymenobacter sp. CRA2]OON70510.1 hypothetical protein B0919_00310 [Hymenobacter sp. CRA2]